MVFAPKGPKTNPEILYKLAKEVKREAVVNKFANPLIIMSNIYTDQRLPEAKANRKIEYVKNMTVAL